MIEFKHMIGRHTSEMLEFEINKIMCHWKIKEKVHAIVADNASNVKLISERLNDNRGCKITQFSCAAHVLNLIVSSFTKKLNGNTQNDCEPTNIEDEEHLESKYFHCF